MKLLLDTHVFLWLISDDPRLRPTDRQTISDSSNEVYLSVVSVWEAAVKHAIRRLPLPSPPGVYLPAQRQRHRILNLDLDEQSVAMLDGLPAVHRDPFDRILICQALGRGLTIMTSDRVFESYQVPLLKT
jgi:PIN domain nuclease of toxin-antitoxin system